MCVCGVCEFGRWLMVVACVGCVCLFCRASGNGGAERLLARGGLVRSGALSRGALSTCLRVQLRQCRVCPPALSKSR